MTLNILNSVRREGGLCSIWDRLAEEITFLSAFVLSAIRMQWPRYICDG